MKNNITHRDRTTDLGAVRINNDAITTIASVAALEVMGVAKIGGTMGRTLLERAFRKTSTKGVRIDSAEGETKLSVSIIVDYNVDIPRIADEVQENVKRAVEKMTGLVLSEVNVVVEGVAIKPRVIEKKI